LSFRAYAFRLLRSSLNLHDVKFEVIVKYEGELLNRAWRNTEKMTMQQVQLVGFIQMITLQA